MRASSLASQQGLLEFAQRITIRGNQPEASAVNPSTPIYVQLRSTDARISRLAAIH